MCLNTNTTTPSIAKSAIVVYKSSYKRRVPIFSALHSNGWNGFKYTRFKKQPTVEMGVRDYTESYRYSNRPDNPVEVNKAYHSYSEKGKQMFLIPKGAKYFKGSHNGERDGYASDSIIWIGSVWNPFNWVIALLAKL